MRLLNIIVIAALILAASIVYKIKFDSTLQAERVGKLASELRRERNAIATLRAEWSRHNMAFMHPPAEQLFEAPQLAVAMEAAARSRIFPGGFPEVPMMVWTTAQSMTAGSPRAAAHTSLPVAAERTNPGMNRR